MACDSIGRTSTVGRMGVVTSAEGSHRRRYPSLKDVAKEAGVSFQTASKVLSGSEVRVAPATAERIIAAARDLGYARNIIASSLVRSSTATIGLIMGSLRDPALAEFAYGVEAAARGHGQSVLVANVGDQDGAEAVRILVERRVDGIIAAAPHLEEDLEVADFLRRYVPCVSLHHVPGGGVPLVGSSMREVGWIAADHLLKGGRKQLGTVAGPLRRRVVRSRVSGLDDRLREAGISTELGLLAEADWSADGAAKATRLLLAQVPHLDAIFVHSDLMSIGVLDALHHADRRVPDDVAVVSCDDLPFAAHLNPPLTTVHIPFMESGAEAANLLCRLIAGEHVDPSPLLLPVELVVRTSSLSG